MEDISHATWQGLFLALNGTSLLGERTPPNAFDTANDGLPRSGTNGPAVWSGSLALQRANVKLTHYRGRA